MSTLRTLALIRKEFLHILRDPRTLFVMFAMPIIQLMLLGYAATTDVEHLRTAVVDCDKSSASRNLIEAYRASNYFDIVRHVESEEQLEHLIDRGEVRAGVIIPSGYGAQVSGGGRTEVGFVIDGSDTNVANTVFSASQSVGQAHSKLVARRQTGIDLEGMPGVTVRPRVWYNPEMRSANFMIPGIIGIILYFLTALFTSMSIVREREQGTIEQLIVTPIKPLELIIGKVTPYILVAFFDVLEVLAIGVFWFGVPIQGNLGLLLGLSALFLLTSLGVGIFISSVSNTQQEAMLLTFLTMFPCGIDRSAVRTSQSCFLTPAGSWITVDTKKCEVHEGLSRCPCSFATFVIQPPLCSCVTAMADLSLRSDADQTEVAAPQISCALSQRGGPSPTS